MDTLSEILSILLWLLIGVPVGLVLHEFGHAIMILLLTKQKTTFQFGTRGPKWEFRLGRLTILIYFEPGTFLGCRYYIDRSELTRSQVFWTLIGGPLASLFFAMLCGVLWWATDATDPWKGMVIMNLIAFLWTSIPGHYARWMSVQGGFPNDGLQLVYLFQQAKTKAAHITSAIFSPTNLRAGELLNVSITVQNNTNGTLRSQDPDPGFVYEEGESFLSRGFPEVKGAFRVGIDFDGRTDPDYPYRWGLGAPLAPGQTATITGAILMKHACTRNYWSGLVRELVYWQQEFAGKQTICVLLDEGGQRMGNG